MMHNVSMITCMKLSCTPKQPTNIRSLLWIHRFYSISLFTWLHLIANHVLSQSVTYIYITTILSLKNLKYNVHCIVIELYFPMNSPVGVWIHVYKSRSSFAICPIYTCIYQIKCSFMAIFLLSHFSCYNKDQRILQHSRKQSQNTYLII